MSELRKTISRGWLILSSLMIVLEVFFIYEAMLADASGLERIFGVFTGLGLLCFGVLLYVLTSIVYT
jgi:hypothetical protein